MPRRILFSFLIAMVAITFVGAPLLVHAESSTRYVDKDAGVDQEGGCLDPQQPCKSISYALWQADRGDMIKIARGVYEVTTITITKDVSLIGGFDPQTWESCADLCGGGCFTTLDGSPIESPSQTGRFLLDIQGPKVVLENLKLTNGPEGAIRATGYGVHILNSRIEGNHSGTWVSGVELTGSSLWITRSIFAHNDGAALIVAGYTSNVSLVNASFVDNTYSRGRGKGILAPAEARVVITSSILWGDNITHTEYYPGRFIDECSLWYSNIQQECPADCDCTEVMSEDPMFVDREKGDYRLEYDSPVRNLGDPEVKDPDGSRVDMGACPYDERIPTATPTPTNTNTPTPTPTLTPTNTPTPTPTVDLRKTMYFPCIYQKRR